MPRGNGTGPMGMGPMSGRGAGYCAGYAMPGQMNQFGGRGGGFGCGFGRGAGFGRGRFAAGAAFIAPPYGVNQQAAWGTVTAEQEQAALKSQLANLDKLSSDLRQRLSDLENAETNKQ